MIFILYEELCTQVTYYFRNNVGTEGRYAKDYVPSLFFGKGGGNEYNVLYLTK